MFIDLASQDDFWKEKDDTFYDLKNEDGFENEEELIKTPEVDSSFNRRNTFSEQELEMKRQWIQKMKNSLHKSKHEYFLGTSPEHSKTKNPG